MKLSKLIISMAIFTSLGCNLAMAQQNIAGVYSRSSGNPEGGNTFFILDDHQFAVAFFGGVITGSWSIENNEVKFIPYVSEHQFHIYGRHNKTLNDSVRIYFQSFNEQQTLIGFGKTEANKPLLKAVFNPNPNCVPYPTVAMFKEMPEKILFSDQPFSNDKELKRNVYTFKNTEKYNDFIAYYIEDDNDKRPFSAKLKDGKLFFDYDEEGADKRPLPTVGEDFEFINQILAAPKSTDKVFYNPFYNRTAENVNDLNNWKFDESKNAYINLHNYIEGEENTQREDDSYDRVTVVYQFNLLTLVEKKIVPFTIDQKPIFVANCNGN